MVSNNVGPTSVTKINVSYKRTSRKGYPALPKEKRSENEVILTGLFCRAKLMTAIPENLRHMLGQYNSKIFFGFF